MRTTSALKYSLALLSLAPACLLMASCSSSSKPSSEQSSSVPQAQSVLRDVKGKTFGKATLIQAQDGVRMVLELENLSRLTKRTELPIHIHAQGLCEGPEFKSAGPHFNPEGKSHGLMNPKGHHAGDQPMIQVKKGAATRIERMLVGVTLDPTAPNSLLKSGGTSLVIHDGVDDQVSDPAGNAGPRMLCGVIEARQK